MNIEKKIGFDKIIVLLKSYALSSMGRERIETIKFLLDKDKIDILLNQTAEFKEINQTADDFPTNFFYDAKPILHKIKIENTYMSVEELVQLKRSLETLKAIVRYFKTEQTEGKYPDNRYKDKVK